jgi:hypothetical protein
MLLFESAKCLIFIEVQMARVTDDEASNKRRRWELCQVTVFESLEL